MTLDMYLWKLHTEDLIYSLRFYLHENQHQSSIWRVPTKPNPMRGISSQLCKELDM